MGATILVVVEDLLFLSKIQQTAQLTGVTVKPLDPTRGLEKIAEEAPRALILDLNYRPIPALEVVRNLKAHPGTKAIPIVGFVSHVQSDLIAAAREAGCELVLARSAFTQQLPKILRNLLGQ
jgi:CheY-like chemotaxis protein